MDRNFFLIFVVGGAMLGGMFYPAEYRKLAMILVAPIMPEIFPKTLPWIYFFAQIFISSAILFLAGVPAALYERLWDQDEAMMVRRQALLEGRIEPGAREVSVDGIRSRIATVCPHLGGPLDDAPIEAGCITCPWHGYRFDVRTGESADGRRLRLRCAPVD